MTITAAKVTLPSDTGNSGKAIDNTLITNENSEAVYREAVSIGDAGTGSNRLAVDSNGAASVAFAALAQSRMVAAPINATTEFSIAGVAGKSIKLYRLILFVNETTTIQFFDGTQPLSGPMPFNPNGCLVLDNTGDPWYQAAAGDYMKITAGTSGAQLTGTAYYVQN